MSKSTLRPSPILANVRYEIRGRLARRAHEMERLGYDIISLNIGNPGAFGFRTPETMRLAMIENLRSAEGYCHQKGIFPAREAVVMQQQERGVRGVTAEEVFIGNGVSELIDLVLRALLATDDEVLVPSPDYPLWTAAVNLNRGRAVHYPCRPERGFVPDPAEIEALVTPRTRAIVVINPNNPTGAVYPAAVLESIAAIAERHQLVVLADEIYDQMTYEQAALRADGDAGASHAVCHDERALKGVPRLRLSRGLGLILRRSRAFARVPHGARTAVLAAPVQQRARAMGRADRARRLPEHPRAGFPRRTPARVASRDTRGGGAQPVSRAAPPMGALYAFIGVRRDRLPTFDDQEFALDLLEHKHVLVAPGSSFNVPYRNHFRITNLPGAAGAGAGVCADRGVARELCRGRAACGPARAGFAPGRRRSVIVSVEIGDVTH